MWKRVSSSGGMMEPYIPSHWEKVDDIPSDEEYKKQCEKIEELWDKYEEEMTKK